MVRASGSSTSSAASISDWGAPRRTNRRGRRGLGPPPTNGGRGAPPGNRNRPSAPPFVGSPQLFRRNILDAPPQIGIGVFLAPFRPHIPVVELIHLIRDPGAKMHAVG